MFQSRIWLEELVSNVVQRQVTIETERDQDAPASIEAIDTEKGEKDMRARAMDDQAVQSMLEVFSTEISDVEEIES